MAKGKESSKKSPKESPKENPKESPNEASVNARSPGFKDERRKKKSSSSSSSARDVLPEQPSPPHPIKSASSSTNTKLAILKRNSQSPEAGDVVMEQGVASTKEEAERMNLEAAKEFQRIYNEGFYQEKAALEKAALEGKKCRSDSEGETTSQSMPHYPFLER